MKIVFILCCSICSILFAQEPLELNYCIRPASVQETPSLEVLLEFQGSEEGITAIQLPSSWADQNDLYQEITLLQSLTPHSHIEETDKPSVKNVYHMPNARLKISYLIQTRRNGSVREKMYRPMIEQSYFFCFGHSLFILPCIDIEYANIHLEWQDFPPEWTLASSFGVGTKKQSLSLPISTFKQTLFAGGDFRILQCGDKERPIFLAMRGILSFSDEQLSHLVKTTLESQRLFWNDFDFPFYLVTILPTGPNSYLGGTSVSNAFSIFLGDFSNDWKKLCLLLSHEHFHTWNGGKMEPSPSDGSLYWFTEGFTEYYAATLSLRSGLINFNDYIDRINSILYDYHLSPACNVTNETIQQRFWHDQDIHRLPYVRGFLFALKWDKQMTQKHFSLDDFIRALFKKTLDSEGSFTLTDIEQIASRFLDPKTVRKDLDSYILHGVTLTPDPNYFGTTCTLDWTEHRGFNINRARSNGYIEGVKEKSPAFQAGLRNGQKFLDYHCIDRNITLRIIDEEGAEKELKYSSQLVPQYRLQATN